MRLPKFGRPWSRRVLAGPIVALIFALALLPATADARSGAPAHLRRDSTPTPTPISTPSPTPSPSSNPHTSIQALVDAAAPGTTVTVPAGIYRETVTIDKPLTLVGQPGAEIRGSDVWSSGWTRSGGYFVRGTVPSFPVGSWPCEDSTTPRCDWPEQVFFDGRPLLQVAADPVSGQFAVDAARRVVLADNPTGHLVEVTTRQYWILGQADNVTVQGFTMKHAATPAQQGAISNGGHSNWTIQNNVLSDVHGAVVSLNGGDELKLLDNVISRGGQLGVHGYLATSVLIQGNHISDNNTEGFSSQWEAGGIKTGTMTGLIVDSNEIDHNDGPGFWCDIQCGNTTVSNNRTHHNGRSGIDMEISTGARIFGNQVWENGWSSSDWGWGAGILCQNSGNAEIYDNIVAWNADGISVISTNRGDSPPVVNDTVHDNDIFTVSFEPAYQSANVFALAWLQDWNGSLGDPASNNTGFRNHYWHEDPAGAPWPFNYAGAEFPFDQLAQFSQTAGEHDGTYISSRAKVQILTSAGIPTAPETH